MSDSILSLDFDSLEVGQRITSPARTIAEADLVSFSALTGDHHPQHTDAVWAARGPFGERIAHGMLVLSYSLGLLPIDPERVIALRGVRNVVFKRPVAIGATINVQAEVASLKPLNEDHGLVELTLKIRDAEGRLVTRAVLEALWRREPALTPERGNGAGALVADGALSPLADGRLLF